MDGDQITFRLFNVNGPEEPEFSQMKTVPTGPYLLVYVEENTDPAEPMRVHVESGNMADEDEANAFNDILGWLTRVVEIDDEGAHDE